LKRRVYIAVLILAALIFPPLQSQQQPAPQPQQPQPQTPVRDIVVPRDHFLPNYRDMEIRDWLKTMAEVTRKNILVDEAVKGKITVISFRPIHISRALDFMKQVLQVRGFAVVEEPNLIKVIAVEDASAVSIPQDALPDADSTGMISKVIKLPSFVNLNEMATLLKSVAGRNTVVAPYRPNNSIVLTGFAQNVRRVLTIANELMTRPEIRQGEGGSTDTVHIYRVRNMPAESLASVLVRLDNPSLPASPPPAQAPAEGQQPVQQPISQPVGPGGKIKAVSHKESNSIIVTANQAEWNEILQIIQQLDTERKQILLEVLIAEVTSSRLNDFGIDWRYQGTNGPHTQMNTGMAVQGKLVDTTTGRITGNNTLSGFSLGFLQRGGSILGVFNANVNNRNFNVLSSPQVLTLDNQEAEINVGQDVPVQTQSRTSGGGTAEATVNSFEYRPSGIKLKFTPHINAEGMITLDMFSEVTSIEGAGTVGQNPTFNKRNVKTYVTVDNLQTIVIGGLVADEQQLTIQKIPLLGDVPLLGFLFRRTTTSIKRTNLMIFLTPHILDNREDSDRVTQYKRREQIDAVRERHNNLRLWPQGTAPRGREEQLDTGVGD